ncbi:hypothetical protein G6F68_012719 [Rhizopus microsporus]|nr:hypothetical protein G6F68_012719 [Rhizopus microsporus]
MALDGGMQRAAQLAGAGGVHLRVVAGRHARVARVGIAAGAGHGEGDAAVGGRVRALQVGEARGAEVEAAGLAGHQRGVGGQLHAASAGREGQRHAAGGATAQREGAAGQVHRLAEHHFQVGGGREGGAALRRGGGGHRRRRVRARRATAAEGLAVVAAAECLSGRLGPGEVRVLAAAAGQLQRGARRPGPPEAVMAPS